MGFTPENLGIAETGLPLLCDLIQARTGLSYANGRVAVLSERLAPLVLARGFQSFLDYYYLLKYDDRAAGEHWQQVMNVLSVQETYFWREFDQVRALTCAVLPELVRARAGRPIRIWSVPCATGEEPLTLAMALEEAGWFQRVPIEIHASDGSAAAIEKARAGTYRERSFRALPDHLRERYFTESGGVYTPVASLRARIASWSVVNLINRDEIAPYAASPVIFCRNVFIYFSPQSIRRVVEMFEHAMPVPGFLFVAAAESLLSISDRFTLEELDRAFVYTKR